MASKNIEFTYKPWLAAAYEKDGKLDLTREVVRLSDACKTPKRDQRIKIGGIYAAMLLEQVNELSERLAHKPLKLTDLRNSKFLGRPITLVEEDVLEVY